MSDLVFRNGGKLAALAVLTIVVGVGGADGVRAEPCPPELQLPAERVCDLNGEVCLSGTEDIDGHTYCLMLGRLAQNEALEMDDVDCNNPVSGEASTVADANVRAGTPAGTLCPGGNNNDLPTVDGATYIDWNDLAFNVVSRPDGIRNITTLDQFSDGKPKGSVEDHRITDFTGNADYNIFASKSCVTAGTSLPKEDFTQSYLANNDGFLYFGQERRTNSGNSVFYWMLTKEPPVIDDDDPDCLSTRGELQFTLTPRTPTTRGDFQVFVNFPSSSNPAGGTIFLREYIGPAASGVPAREALFTPGGWTEGTTVENFALVISDAIGRIPGEDDQKPDWGGIDQQGKVEGSSPPQYYDTAAMAEWAVNLETLFGGAPICGQRLFVTGISRSATGQTNDPDESADLKDLIGPKLYSFGEIEASATVEPVCDPAVSYDYVFDFAFSATDVTHGPIESDDLKCFIPGTTTEGVSCTSSCGAASLTYNDLSYCTGRGTIARSGGGPSAGPCPVSCAADVTQVSSSCVDSTDDAVDALAPILVNISPNMNEQKCPDEAGIASGITFSAYPSGGDLNYTYVWSVYGPSPTCGNAVTCNINFAAADFCADTTVKVTVKDTSICPDKDSELESVSKTTLIKVN